MSSEQLATRTVMSQIQIARPAHLSPGSQALLSLTTVVLDWFHATGYILPSPIRAMLAIASGTLELNDDSFSRDVFGYFRAVLESEGYAQEPLIRSALDAGLEQQER
jgi:hypothetical protein